MRIQLLIISVLASLTALAQPVNDECANAIELTDIQNWCSATEAYSNISTSTSAQDRPGCFTQAGHDIWFRFTANSTSINIRVLGDIVDIYGITDFSQGTMQRPQLALYQGDCASLNLVGCDEDRGDHIAELYADNLIPNATYYLRIGSTPANAGSFTLCISSFNFVPDPNSDCPTGVVLCDKSSFFVDALSGVGDRSNEVNASCIQQESGSAWYKWVAGRDGSLGFTITPNNPGDDIDFVIFELPGGLDDCDNLSELRCMASGANGINQFGPFIPAPFNEWDECTGPTGLSQLDDDLVETPGCQTGIDNNFAAAIQMEEGKAYGLLINNYSESGHGFSIEFDGTGEFLGPEADFSTDDIDGTICFGQPVVFFDESSFGDLSLTDWEWNFGEGAIPQTARGPGPHQVNYELPGSKSIALTVESETGCLVTTIGSLIVEAPFDIQADIVHQSCPESDDGSINLNINSGSRITDVLWDTGETGNLISGLTPGFYEATITNFNGCDTTIRFEIESPQPLQIEEIITRPSCGGGSDGSVTLNVSGQAPPFVFNFNDGSGFTLNNTLSGIPADLYDISIRDNNGCITDLTVALGEVNINLDPNHNPVTPPSCFGFRDGRIAVQVLGGDTGYAYDWNLNGTYVPDSIFDGVGAGNRTIRIRDELNCIGFVSFDIPEPPELRVSLDTVDVSCNGAADGSVLASVQGGTGAYNYTWNHGDTDFEAEGLAPGNYLLTVRDANNCTAAAAASITEPPILDIQIDSIGDVLCFGDQSGIIRVMGNGGSPPFTYSIDGGNFQEDSLFTNLAAGTHILTVRDLRGCTSDITAEIFQPEELIVDAGEDTIIDLGFTASLLATHLPPGKPVSWQWNTAGTGSCDDCPFPTVMPIRTTTYTVTITDEDNCSATDSVTVIVYLNRPVFIPNSITPNGDGFNDRLTVYAGVAAAPQGVQKLQIFDRWGEMVWEGTNLPLNDESVGWDGTHNGRPLNPGVFVYVAEVTFIDNSVLTFEGDITLIR